MIRILAYICSTFLFIGHMIPGEEKEPKVIVSVFIKDKQKENIELLVKPVFFEAPTKSDNRVEVRSIWDNDSLYFLIEVVDKDLRAYQHEKDHPLLYLDDMIEILIDAENHKNDCWSVDDIVYHINLLGQKKDDRGTDSCLSDSQWDGNARYTLTLRGTLNNSTDIDQGYSIEIAFPWEELGVKPEIGRIIGINFANGDNDGNGRQLFDWSGAWPLRTPSQFGSLILEE